MLQRYIDTFKVLGELCDELSVPGELCVGSGEDFEYWEPRSFATQRSALYELFNKLNADYQRSVRMPALFEGLLLSFRWCEVRLDRYRLLPNIPAADHSPFLAAVRSDPGIYSTLSRNGYVQFARAVGGGEYDPVCFDLNSRRKNDCRIVRLDHEAILCYESIRKVEELAPTFRSLIHETIRQADIKLH